MVVVLLLNASYEPLRVIPLRRAMGLLLAGKADPVETRDGELVRSAGGDSWPMPLVVRLRYMVTVPYRSRVPLTRRTLHVRDGGRCQVSGCSRAGNTIDHVLPRSRSGQHEWTNVALMCGPHNHKKSDKLLSELGWTLKARPVAPRGVVLSELADPAWEAWLPTPALV